MRTLVVVVCAVAWLLPFQVAAQESVKDELIALDKKFDEARRQKDIAVLADIMTDDFLRVPGSGLVQTKADVLKAVATANPPTPAPPDSVPPIYTVYLYGDTAVMAHAQKGTDVVPASAVTHVFAKQQGRWKMVGWANTIAPPSTEQRINSAGYQLMESGKLQDALELFEMNVRLHPNSWNAYDSLAEGYESAGKTELAIQNYEKSMQMNPENDRKAAVAKLRNK